MLNQTFNILKDNCRSVRPPLILSFFPRYAPCFSRVQSKQEIASFIKKVCHIVCVGACAVQLFLTGYSIGKKRMLDVSMTRNDKALKYVAGMAMRFKCGVVVSFPERPDFRTDVMFISAIVFDSAGSEVCLYVHTPPA